MPITVVESEQDCMPNPPSGYIDTSSNPPEFFLCPAACFTYQDADIGLDGGAVFEFSCR